MTPELFMDWKKKKTEEREAGFAAQRAERAKNDRMRYGSVRYPVLSVFETLELLLIWSSPHFSGRELFLMDASLFVDDAEAYERYQRQEEPESSEQTVIYEFATT